MSDSAVYFDHNATSPPDPRVVEAMLPWFGAQHGNPSSLHRFGQAARGAVELARHQVARLVGGRPEEVVFSGSGTEAINSVVAGVLAPFAGDDDRRPLLVHAAFEHPAVTAACARAEATAGAVVRRIDPTADGRVRPADIGAALQPENEKAAGTLLQPALVSLMLANNEIGTVQPVAEVAAVAREAGALMLCDVVQAVGKIPVDVRALGVDLAVLGGHKFHGPLGAAALWTRTGVELDPLLVGGGQERRRRAGTENVPAIVGLGEAARLARGELESRQRHLAGLRDRFEHQVADWPEVTVHCRGSERLPNTSNLRFEGLRAQDLLIRLDLRGFAVSTGSACSSGAVEPSPTLLALGLAPDEALASLRVSFGIPNTEDEVDRFVVTLRDEVDALIATRPVAAAGAGASS